MGDGIGLGLVPVHVVDLGLVGPEGGVVDGEEPSPSVEPLWNTAEEAPPSRFTLTGT